MRCPSTLEVIASANEVARLGPSEATFAAARQIYVYAPGTLYELHASTGFVSTILLESGETINAIAAGDTSRWMVTEASSEAEGEARPVVLVKPHAGGLSTNIVIVTDRRIYAIEARSSVRSAYTAELAWTYPVSAGAPVEQPGAAPSALYRVRTVRGRAPVWAPRRVYDDGARTWIEFDPSVSATDLPPLFVITAEGAELVNYRVEGLRYVVDRTFDRAELRFGVRAPTVVRIDRVGAEQRRRTRRGRP